MHQIHKLGMMPQPLLGSISHILADKNGFFTMAFSHAGRHLRSKNVGQSQLWNDQNVLCRSFGQTPRNAAFPLWLFSALRGTTSTKFR